MKAFQDPETIIEDGDLVILLRRPPATALAQRIEGTITFPEDRDEGDATCAQANRNDVWHSADGVNCREVPNTPWRPRHAASVFVHDGAVWMVAGNNMESDVWKLTRKKRKPCDVLRTYFTGLRKLVGSKYVPLILLPAVPNGGGLQAVESLLNPSRRCGPAD